MATDRDPDPLIDEVLALRDDEADDQDFDYDLGDDEQADEVREYERAIEDPPQNLIIGYHDDDGRQGITADLDQSWTRRRSRDEQRAEDGRPAEVAAMEVVTEPED